MQSEGRPLEEIPENYISPPPRHDPSSVWACSSETIVEPLAAFLDKKTYAPLVQAPAPPTEPLVPYFDKSIKFARDIQSISIKVQRQFGGDKPAGEAPLMEREK